MDDTSQKLLQALSEIGSRVPGVPSIHRPASRKPIADQEGSKHDRWRILLVEWVYLIHMALHDVHFWEDAKVAGDCMRQLSKILDELDQMPVHDGQVRISCRTGINSKIAQRAEYVIQFGGITVDVPAVVSLIARMGIRLKHLEGRLLLSFETLSNHRIQELALELTGESPEAMSALRESLQVISGFNRAVEKKTAIVITQTQKPYPLFPILNQDHQPDANLTMLAAVNRIDQNTVDKLLARAAAQKGRAVIQPPIMDAIFEIMGLQQQLIPPPIRLTIDPAPRSQSVSTTATPHGHLQKMKAELKADPSVLKESVARFVKGKFGQSPQTASQMMQIIYGMDYQRINSQGLGRRLKLVTDLLNSMQRTPGGQNVALEVLKRIQARMDQVPDEILEDFIVTQQDLKFWSGGEEKTVSKVDKDLLKIIDHSKSRSDARKQNRMPLPPEKNYAERNFEAIAEDFGISVKDTAAIIHLFKKCFDGQGNFLRAAFEKKVSGFAAYEKKVFEILWAFLKETSRRSNRLPLLYSLQLLVRETKQPIQAIKLLLADFIQDPAIVSYADRNAIMLVNQFLRSYIKESDMDIEMTPDEVLRVRGGLDNNAVNYVIWKIDTAQEAFIEKMLSIRKKLVAAMEPETAVEPFLPARFLLALEREVHIFSGLIGARTTFEVLSAALNVYGNPASQIYHLKQSPNLLEPLLLHLATIVCGFIRHADKSHFSLLAEVKSQQDRFRALHPDLRYHALVRQVMGFIDEDPEKL